MGYIRRFQERQLGLLLKQFPVVCLTGPRQAGKSTLLKYIKEPSWEYLSLDQIGTAERAHADPDLFVGDLKTPAIIDEAQKAPPIFHAIKAEVDSQPKKKFILSGSANFSLMHNITETLAGRSGVLELLPFSAGEIAGVRAPGFLTGILKSRSFRELFKFAEGFKVQRMANPYRQILWGGMPKIRELRQPKEKSIWFENYLTTYIERDLRNLAQVGNLDDFQKFYRAVAFQTGNILNLSDMAKDIGIAMPTCKRYLDILRTSYQAFILPAYHANVKKRLVKTPKCFFADTGIACFLLRYDSEEMLKDSGRLGALFETWFVGEIKKITATMLVQPLASFWKPHAGFEVDLVLESGERLYPMEIKHAARIQPSDMKGLKGFMEDIGRDRIPFGVIWYRGERIQTIAANIAAIPIEYAWH